MDDHDIVYRVKVRNAHQLNIQDASDRRTHLSAMLAPTCMPIASSRCLNASSSSSPLATTTTGDVSPTSTNTLPSAVDSPTSIPPPTNAPSDTTATGAHLPRQPLTLARRLPLQPPRPATHGPVFPPPQNPARSLSRSPRPATAVILAPRSCFIDRVQIQLPDRSCSSRYSKSSN